MTNELQTCIDCGKPESHELHLDDPHGYENRSRTLDCNYEASYEGEENGYVGTCDHHEFEADASGDDAEKRAVMFDGAYDRYMDDQMDRANTAL
jgi:hypothetical protein